jgi:hypothetical protein
VSEPWFSQVYRYGIYTDFPMSKGVLNETRRTEFILTHDHHMLAAQIPRQWQSTPSTTTSADLALRKISFRALMSCLMHRCSINESKVPRIYKIADRHCSSVENYVEAASARISSEDEREQTALLLLSKRSSFQEEERLLRRLRLLHTLRSILGTLIESLILADRFLFIEESTAEDSNSSTRLVNLFDQMKGSGRNVALVLENMS